MARFPNLEAAEHAAAEQVSTASALRACTAPSKTNVNVVFCFRLRGSLILFNRFFSGVFSRLVERELFTLVFSPLATPLTSPRLYRLQRPVA